jgi:hypothetical protein
MGSGGRWGGWDVREWSGYVRGSGHVEEGMSGSEG